ncbi:NCS2 family permease [Marinobacter sp. X15-166B]|uniref:NCS2 family permease n=1 Tax=Marinobacter sp. X15-166B TaxID=1897620 RepID=UPI00085C6907|nr:NCS2 family permease [Marinobacter sp. X15-166B]OEY65272.1 guanine permease [Marinobacter sp. X15-166B]
MLERLFQLKAHGTNVRKEVVAGFTTFLTMAYVIVVNPSILSGTGMDFGAIFVATCLAATIGTLIMGLWANYPIALAPGMGLNAFFSFTVVGSMGYSWQIALGAVFISGFLFFILSLFRVREWIINSIPLSLRFGISAGIGFFLALIAFKNAGVVIDNPATLVGLGDIKSAESLLFFGGFLLTCALAYRGVTGAVMIGIIAVTLVAMVLGLVQYKGFVSAPPSLAPTFMQLDLAGALNVTMISVVFAFLFVDLFDTSGTLIGAAQRGGLLDKDGRLPRLGRALMSDSVATMSGAALGTSTTTSYIESTAGIAAGGRTGLTAVVVALLFLACLLLSPIASIIPPYATAPALLYVAVLMTSGLKLIDWEDVTEAAPAVVTALMMPLTFSIANGIALGFITYALLKMLSGRWNQLSVSVAIIALVFILKFTFLYVPGL